MCACVERLEKTAFIIFGGIIFNEKLAFFVKQNNKLHLNQSCLNDHSRKKDP